MYIGPSTTYFSLLLDGDLHVGHGWQTIAFAPTSSLTTYQESAKKAAVRACETALDSANKTYLKAELTADGNPLI